MSMQQIPRKTISAACGCHVGLRRENNEDNFLFGGRYLPVHDQGIPKIWTLRDSAGADRFFAVFDGVGGGDCGEVASNTAAASADAFFADQRNINPYDITPTLTRLCLRMNETVFEKARSLGAYQMGTTVVSLFFYKGCVWVCNLGDSRGYRYRSDWLEQLSADHTDAETMARSGVTGRKPCLTQYLGVNPEELLLEPHIRMDTVESGDRYLLCSDGLTDMVSEEAIRGILAREAEPKICVHQLMQAALEGGGRDNITVMVIDVE